MPSSFARPGVLRRFTRPAVTRAAYGARMALAVAPESPAYVPSAHDRVTGEVMLPEGASAAFHDRALLWNAVDRRAGRGDARPPDGRPGPVSGLELLLGLPRLHELAVEEMAAMVRGFCARFTECGLAVQWDVHAPVVFDAEPIAVHAHVLVSGRPVRGDQILRGRERRFDTVARPGVRISHGWSREWRMHQERFFAEHGIVLAVAAPSGGGEIPMGRTRFRTARREALQEKRRKRRAELHDPAALIAVLLRDRWLMTQADVTALVDSVIINPDERPALVARVIADPALVTPPGWADGEAWTTLEWLARARRAMVHAERTRLPPLDPPASLYDPDDPTAPEPEEAPISTALSVEVGESLCEAMLRIAGLVGPERVVVAASTVAAFAAVEAVRTGGLTLKAAQELVRSGAKPSPLDRREPVLLLAMPEMLHDRELAALLERAELAGAKLVPISDLATLPRSPTSLLSQIMGTRRRLARLRALLPDNEADEVPTEDAPGPTGDPRIDLTEDAAIARVAEAALRNGQVVVATRTDTVTRIAAAVRAHRAARGEINLAMTVRLGGLGVSPGDRIVVLSAWNRETPPGYLPSLERGAILDVVAIDSHRGHVDVKREDGRDLVLKSEQAHGTLAYADALPLRVAIVRPVAHHMVLDEPSTAIQALDLWRDTRGRGSLFVDAPVEAAAAAADEINPWASHPAGTEEHKLATLWEPSNAAIDDDDFENAAHAVSDSDGPDDEGAEPEPSDLPYPDPDDIEGSEFADDEDFDPDTIDEPD